MNGQERGKEEKMWKEGDKLMEGKWWGSEEKNICTSKNWGQTDNNTYRVAWLHDIRVKLLNYKTFTSSD